MSVCVCVYLETPPFVCIVNGSRFTVSQGCGVAGRAGGGHFSATAGQGLFIFMHPAVPEEPVAPPPTIHTPFEVAGSGLEWILGGWAVNNVGHLGCCCGRHGCRAEIFHQSLFL